MTLEAALEKDILSVLPFGGDFLSVDNIAKRVSPLREREVRGALNRLVKQRVLDLNGGGRGWPYLYGRRALRRPI